MAREQALPLVVPERLQEPRRVDDVREEERATRLDAAEQLLDARLLDGAAPSRSKVDERRLELDRTRVLVAAPQVGDAEQRSRARGLVRRSDALPLLAGVLQRRDRDRPVLLREPDLATREVHGRVERGSASTTDLVRVDDLLALVGRRASRLEIAGGDGDLDLRGKSAEAEERLRGVLERACDPGDGRVDLPLGEPEEREARLRIPAHLARDAIGLLGAREVAAATPDLADLVVARRP